MTSSRRTLAAALAALAWLASPAHAAQREDYSRAVDRTVTLRPGQRLEVAHRHGDLAVQGVSGSDLKVVARIRVSAPSRQGAERFGSAIEIRVDERGDVVRVATVYPRGRWRDISFSVDYDIQAPAGAPLELANSFGNVTLSGVETAVVKNAHGSLQVSDAQGRQRLENAFGATVVRRVLGDVAVVSANGEVSADEVGGDLVVTNRFGRVVARAVKGAAQISNSNAEVLVGMVRGPARVRNRFGAVELALARGTPCARVELATSFAPIRLMVPDEMGLDLTGSTSFGAIRSDLPVAATGVVAADSLRGTVAGGGCAVILTNARGDIEIRKALR